jgi:hypothetical protein
VVVRRGQIRRIGWVIKTLEAQVGQFLLGCKCPVSRGIVVQEQDPLGDLPYVQIFMNDGPNPVTWDAQLLSYWFSPNPAVFQDSVLRYREVGGAKDLSAPPRTFGFMVNRSPANTTWAGIPNVSLYTVYTGSLCHPNTRSLTIVICPAVNFVNHIFSAGFVFSYNRIHSTPENYIRGNGLQQVI